MGLSQMVTHLTLICVWVSVRELPCAPVRVNKLRCYLPAELCDCPLVTPFILQDECALLLAQVNLFPATGL